jgi:hypothetical protein
MVGFEQEKSSQSGRRTNRISPTSIRNRYRRRKRRDEMLHIRDNTGDEHRQGWNNIHPAVRSLLRSAWELFKAFVINARDVLGSGRINL